MTEQEIIDMAKRAGVTVRGHYDESGSTPQELLRFAKLVAKKEREALKSICEELEQHYSDYAVTALLNGDVDLSNAASGEPRACRAILDAIRSRGEKESNHG